MKKSALLLGAVALALAVGSARADVLAGWTFESSGLGSSSPTYLPGANTASTNFYAETGLFAGTAAAFGFHVGASTYSGPAGNGSLKSLSSQTWAVGDFYQFVVPLNSVSDSFSAFSVSYDQNGSATGPGTFYLAYSLNGTSFTKIGSDYGLTASVTWTSSTTHPTQLTYDLSGISAQLATANTIYFRIVDDSATAINGSAVAAGGTDRVDNFTVNATVAAVPEPTTIALATVGGLGCLFAWRRKR